MFKGADPGSRSSHFRDGEAAESLREFLSEALIGRVAMVLDTADAPLRATLVGSQLVGLAVGRYLLRIEPLASAPPATVAAWIAPTWNAT